MLAGRAAEKAFLGSISSGADDDIRTATQLARAMVARWGMSEEVGPVDVRESDEHPFLGREIAQPRKVSEATAQAVDAAVRRLLTEAEQRAETVLTSHRAAVERLIASLEHNETLDRAAIDQCLAPDERAGQQDSVNHHRSLGSAEFHQAVLSYPKPGPVRPSANMDSAWDERRTSLIGRRGVGLMARPYPSRNSTWGLRLDPNT
jgi:hypothetical protein